MSTKSAGLNALGNDVSDIMRHLPSGLAEERRIGLARTIGRAFRKRRFKHDGERREALAVLDRLSEDTSRRVRTALAECVAAAPELPRPLAEKIASDIADVAAPVLARTLNLDERFLVDVAERGDAVKQSAIARRGHVPAIVSDTLIRCGPEPVVSTVLTNDGAEIPGSSLPAAIARFPESVAILAAVGRRDEIPIAVRLEALHKGTQVARVALAGHGDLSLDLIGPLVDRIAEHALFEELAASDEQTRRSVLEQLRHRQRLRPTLLLRALLYGHKRFFEIAFALRSGAGPAEVQSALYQDDLELFRKLAGRADLDDTTSRALVLALPLLKGLNRDGDRAYYRKAVAYKIVGNFRSVAPGRTEQVLAQLIRQAESHRTANEG